ncbi:hypothetical protein AB0K16_15105 [Nonomuraea jabiensis]|uniref:hypothetical protein n=1 Tax=Nonomuraea jabiensis TaxID=882448 RepID=UPI003417B849
MTRVVEHERHGDADELNVHICPRSIRSRRRSSSADPCVNSAGRRQPAQRRCGGIATPYACDPLLVIVGVGSRALQLDQAMAHQGHRRHRERAVLPRSRRRLPERRCGSRQAGRDFDAILDAYGGCWTRTVTSSVAKAEG